MRATNAIVRSAPTKQTFSEALTANTMQSLILRTLGDKAAANRLTATLMEAVSSNEKLQDCTTASIVAAALRGEGAGLIYGHGYYIVPYGDQAKYMTGYKGFIQLALNSGYYADMDCIEVKEGEYKGRDERTGKPKIDLSVYETEDERETKTTIGYYAYYELRDGMFRYEYWPMEKILKYADRFSPAFSLEKYQGMLDGTLDKIQLDRLKRASPWYDIGYGQERMCKKTLLRQLLNSGYAPLSNEMRRAISESDDGIIPDVSIQTAGKPETPEIVAESNVVSEPMETHVEAEESAQSENNKPRTRKKQKEAEPQEENQIDYAAEEGLLGQFFNG